MLKTTSKITSNTPEYVYLNVTITNNSQGENFFGANPPIVFRDTLAYNVVDNPSEYKLSISKFTCEAGVNLPIWSPRILEPENDPNLTVYKITLGVTIGGTTYTQTTPMVYSPETNVQPPASSLLMFDTAHYYYVYTYKHFCYLFNQMLNTCYTALATQAGATFTATCPFIDYDASSGLFSIYFDNNAGAEEFTMAFGANLYNLLHSFYFRNTNNLVIDRLNPNNSITLPDGNKYIKVTQDFISTSTWSPVSALVFTTTTLPIVSEQSTQPLIYNDDNLTTQSSYQVYQKIITDISIPADKSSDWRNYITYTPNFPRQINLNSTTGLKNIDISVFFSDSYTDQLIPVCIGNNSQVKLKLCFQKYL